MGFKLDFPPGPVVIWDLQWTAPQILKYAEEKCTNGLKWILAVKRSQRIAHFGHFIRAPSTPAGRQTQRKWFYKSSNLANCIQGASDVEWTHIQPLKLPQIYYTYISYIYGSYGHDQFLDSKNPCNSRKLYKFNHARRKIAV